MNDGSGAMRAHADGASRANSSRTTRAVAFLVLALGISGCSGPRATTTNEEVEGVLLSEDGVFRYKEFPETSPALAFDAVRFVVRNRFSGYRIVEDRDGRKIETRPMGLQHVNRRIQLFAQVTQPDGSSGSRVEVYASTEELRDDLEAHPDDPWRRVGRDAALENRILRDVFVVLENARTNPPAPR